MHKAEVEGNRVVSGPTNQGESPCLPEDSFDWRAKNLDGNLGGGLSGGCIPEIVVTL
jgi:hypothetical protein